MAKSTGNPVGRPLKYKTPEAMQKMIDLYFLACRVHQQDKDDETNLLIDCSDDDLLVINDIVDVVPAMSGMAYLLGMSRQALCDYAHKDEFLDTIKKARLRVEMSLEQRLANQAVAGTIFNLKNNFDWKDKTETEHTGTMSINIDSKDANTL